MRSMQCIVQALQHEGSEDLWLRNRSTLEAARGPHPTRVALRRRAMVATKPSNPSIVNIASVCGIRGSGKECVSYQVPVPLCTYPARSRGSDAAHSVLIVYSRTQRIVWRGQGFSCAWSLRVVHHCHGYKTAARPCAGGEGGRHWPDSVRRGEAGVPRHPRQCGVAVGHRHGAIALMEASRWGCIRDHCTLIESLAPSTGPDDAHDQSTMSSRLAAEHSGLLLIRGLQW